MPLHANTLFITLFSKPNLCEVADFKDLTRIYINFQDIDSKFITRC